jgi:DUF4097 and DUF4098 domain-containing protein YvlB
MKPTWSHAMRLLALALAISLPLAAMAQDIEKVNGEITVDAGQHAGDVHTVNGGIQIRAGAIVQSAGTVNGSISLGENAQAASLHTVNGRISMETGSRVLGEVTSTNGDISLDPRADIASSLSNTNGTITLDHAHVGGGITTSNGDVTVGEGSRVDGGLVVRQTYGNSWPHRDPYIVIGPHAVVNGALDFRREVVLEVSDSAQIGPVRGATPKRFSGATP